MFRPVIFTMIFCALLNPAAANYYAPGSGRPIGGNERPSGFGGMVGSDNVLLYAIGGVAFVGAMWYLFRTPRSSTYENQVVFKSF